MQDTAPVPYTAEQLASANPQGTWRLYRMLAGDTVSLRKTRFIASDASIVTIESSTFDADNNPTSEPRTMSVSWKDLEQSSAFPADATEIADEEIDTPAGRFRCRRYTVRETSPGGFAEVYTSWFAVDQPGPAVRHVFERNGNLVSTTELVEHGREP